MSRIRTAQRRARLEAYLTARTGRRYWVVPIFVTVADATSEVGSAAWSSR